MRGDEIVEEHSGVLTAECTRVLRCIEFYGIEHRRVTSVQRAVSRPGVAF
jgi:hypothetical protein